MLLGFGRRVINLKNDAVELAVFELPELKTDLGFDSLLGQVTEPAERLVILVGDDHVVDFAFGDPLVGMPVMARNKECAHRLGLTIGGQPAVILMRQAWIAQVVHPHDPADDGRPFGKAAERRGPLRTTGVHPPLHQGRHGQSISLR